MEGGLRYLGPGHRPYLLLCVKVNAKLNMNLAFLYLETTLYSLGLCLEMFKRGITTVYCTFVSALSEEVAVERRRGVVYGVPVVVPAG